MVVVTISGGYRRSVYRVVTADQFPDAAVEPLIVSAGMV